jgi:hypothetical protein
MADSSRPVFESLKQVADGLIAAHEGLKSLADAVLAARDEHEDLRETVHRLESLVITQGHELRALRERLTGRGSAE